MKKVIKLKSLGCANCAAKMEREINKLDGINSASVNFITQKLTLDTNDTVSDSINETIQQIIKKIEPKCKLDV